MGVESPHSLEQEIEQMFSLELSLKKRAFVNYAALKNVLKREMEIGGIKIGLHYNPGRKASVMAMVDPETLKNRQCFLCPEGLSPEQLTTHWNAESGNGYCIRVNPFPIFDKHFTLSANIHTPQAIKGRYADMICFIAGLPDYIVFYNGPKCGASAPDHFHFQAFPKGNLPVENIVDQREYQEVLQENSYELLAELKGYLRGAYLIKSKKASTMVRIFNYLYMLGKSHSDQEWEPRMNVVSWMDGDEYVTVLFFREESRPECFWGKCSYSERRLFISPGAIEMSGVVMTSSEETFDVMTPEMLGRILKEVSLEGAYADKINSIIINSNE